MEISAAKDAFLAIDGVEHFDSDAEVGEPSIAKTVADDRALTARR